MKIITCASYYGCGSSAVTDLFSEYDGVKSLGEFEFRFLQDIDGVSDLEFHLTECPNRHNSGHALKRFMHLSKFNAGTKYNSRYEKYFNGQYLKLTKEYCDKLTLYSYTGHWFYDYYDHRSIKGYYAVQLINKIMNRLRLIKWRPLRNEKTFGVITDKKQFLEYTRDYTHRLLKASAASGAEYLMIDQLIPSSNIDRCMQYIKDYIYVFVVDRDPRDLYTMAKYVWINDTIIPTETPELFCKWFRFTRGCSEGQNTDPTRVIKIKFEDMIYHYLEMRDKLTAMVGLDESKHVHRFSGFNPRRSVVNTQSWKKHPQSIEAIQYIEKALPEYLYDFDAVTENTIHGVECENKTNF